MNRSPGFFSQSLLPRRLGAELQELPKSKKSKGRTVLCVVLLAGGLLPQPLQSLISRVFLCVRAKQKVEHWTINKHYKQIFLHNSFVEFRYSQSNVKLTVVRQRPCSPEYNSSRKTSNWIHQTQAHHCCGQRPQSNPKIRARQATLCWRQIHPFCLEFACSKPYHIWNAIKPCRQTFQVIIQLTLFIN